MQKFISLSLLLLLLGSIPSQAQTSWNSSEDAINWINSKILSVTQDGKKYTQVLKTDLPNTSRCEFTMTEEYNGVVSTPINFHFYIEHLDINLMVAAITGKTLALNISTENNLKLIKEVKGGFNGGFNNKFQIYFDDLQIARNAIEGFKYIKSNLTSSNPYFNQKEEAYAWLRVNVDKVNFGATTIEQSIHVFTDQNNKFTLTQIEKNTKGETKKNYEFYLTDFKTEQIRINASNTRIEVSFATIGDIKPIKYFINGVQQNYTNRFEIFADDAQKAFQIRNVFIYLITGKLDVLPQTANPNLIQSIKGAFEKKESANDPAKKDTVSLKTIPSNPFEKIEGVSIPNPEYDNVPMWYDFNTKNLMNLERVNYSIESRSTGYATSESLIYFDRLSSPVIFNKSDNPLFIIKLSSTSTDPYSIIQLNVATLNKNKNRREFITGQNKIGRNTIKENTVSLSIKKKEAGTYFVTSETALSPGEYFFMFDGKQVFAFSVL